MRVRLLAAERTFTWHTSHSVMMETTRRTAAAISMTNLMSSPLGIKPHELAVAVRIDRLGDENLDSASYYTNDGVRRPQHGDGITIIGSHDGDPSTIQSWADDVQSWQLPDHYELRPGSPRSLIEIRTVRKIRMVDVRLDDALDQPTERTRSIALAVLHGHRPSQDFSTAELAARCRMTIQQFNDVLTAHHPLNGSSVEDLALGTGVNLEGFI